MFVALTYNFDLAWKPKGLREIWVEHNGKISSILQSTDALLKEIILCLPVIHVLTGCDGTSKIGSKKNGMKAASNTSRCTLWFRLRGLG